MNHLRKSEFVDLLEGSPSLHPDRLRHATECSRCRAEVESLRAMRSMASDDVMAEPSPLFWDHFRRRIAEQLRTEPVPVPTHVWNPVAIVTWCAVATVAVLLIAVGVWPTPVHAPAPKAPVQTSAPPEIAVSDPADDLDSDEAWAVVRAAAADVAWEDVHDAGISPHPGDVEMEALQLNAAERVELARLLDADMKRNGA